MIVDTSAIVAIVTEEPDSRPLLEKLSQASGIIKMAAGSRVELSAVLFRTSGEALEARGEKLLLNLGILIEPMTLAHVGAARDAYRRFGRGIGEPPALNFGDCFAYALSKATGEPLLFKGDDFARTDVVVA